MKKLAVLLVAGICVTGITPVDAAEPGWTRHTIWSGPTTKDTDHQCVSAGDPASVVVQAVAERSIGRGDALASGEAVDCAVVLVDVDQVVALI